MKHRIIALCLLLMLTFTNCLADVPLINDMGLELMGSSVHYPQLTGVDPAIQTAVNTAIMEKGRINERLSRMAALINAPVKLNVIYSCLLDENVFSCAILASGAVENSRSTQVWSSVNFDLTTGKEITFADLFTDADEAAAFIEDYLNEQVVPELSAHLAAGSLTPIPETFTLTSTGLTLHYDINAFRTLSEKAGTVTILWSEFPAGMVIFPLAQRHLRFHEDARAIFERMIPAGCFACIPAGIGQDVQDLVNRYALLTDPDIYEGGRMISLEEGSFRQVWILTDALKEDFDRSTVQGIRADRLNYHGLRTGITTVDEWRAALGKPDTTLAVNEDRAEAWRIVPGSSDYYTFGDYRLRLHADESGVLRSIFLTR